MSDLYICSSSSLIVDFFLALWLKTSMTSLYQIITFCVIITDRKDMLSSTLSSVTDARTEGNCVAC